MINNNEALISHLAQGNRVKYLHFWGHTQKTDRVDKSCFSQWFPARFIVDGDTYLTAEHYMMAQKARLFGDDEILESILNCQHPGDAKKLGRKVRNFDGSLWDQHSFDYVIAGNIAKFEQNPAHKTFLLNTKERVLVEASPVDKIWGIGMDVSNPDACNPANWRGQNLLGFALMAAREKIKE